MFWFDYPQNWDEIRKEVYRRGQWTCQRCGTKNTRLYAHHLIPLSEGGSNEPKNLITLCEKCHEDMHFHMRYGKTLGTLSTLLIISYYLTGFMSRISDWAGLIMFLFVFIFGFTTIFISISGFIKTNKAKKELLQKIRSNRSNQEKVFRKNEPENSLSTH